MQRLAWNLEGVRVPPETHFFSVFCWGLLRRRSFPLAPGAVRAELERFLALGTSRGLTLDVDAVVEDVGTTCRTPWDLFAAIVRHLAGPAPVYGEKTPEHLRSWRPLSRRAPWLRVVCVVRDPRAVVASNLRVPFAPPSVPWLAQRWRLDQEAALAARASLGERCLLLRYEDVVSDPGQAVRAMADLLGLPVRPPAEDPGVVDGSALHAPWEWWKARATQEITADRVDAWRAELSSRDAGVVAAICRGPMRRLGYPDVPDRGRSIGRILSVPPADQYRRWHLQAKLFRDRRRLERAAL